MKAEIAVIGMGGIFPNAMDLSEYWSNILQAKDCIVDIPESYWDLSEFYDPDPTARDKTYGYRAGLLMPATFNSMEFGIPPRIMESIAVDQLFSLIVAKQALLDADLLGYNAKPFNREKAGVILSTSIGKTAFSLAHRLNADAKLANIMRNSNVPEHLIERVVDRMKDTDLEWNEASQPGYLPNVTAGRIGNRFDLYGTNCTVDAACAGSLASLKYAINELVSGDCDVVLTGGAMMDCGPFTFVSFSKTPAIAPSNISRPFDDDADGMLLGDTVAMMVLKRLEDAERDNDRIYSVIESISSSADGRAKSIFAPRKEGQLFALDRAYGDAGIDPSSVGLVEAHGTGTTVGDATEIEALTEYFSQYDCEEKSIVVGSVKSQIGHTRLSAGVASMIKSALSLYHNILPPTINVSKPNSQLLNSPFYLTAKSKPWFVNSKRPLRRVGTSAFGFGGTNFHVVMREYKDDKSKFKRIHESPVGLFLSATDKEELIKLCEDALNRFENDDAEYFNELVEAKEIPRANVRIGFVASNLKMACEKLSLALKLLNSIKLSEWQKNDIFYREKALDDGTKIVTMFSGQGSQQVDMFREVSMNYPEMRDMFEPVDNAMIDMDKTPISSIVYPNLFPGERTDEKPLTETRNTQPALAAVTSGLYKILKSRGYNDDFLVGHSFGEITALWAANALDDKTFAEISVIRGEVMHSNVPAGTGMIAVMQSKGATEQLIEGFNKLYVSNENSLSQTIVSGDLEQIEKLEKELSKKGISATLLNVSCAFHSPYMDEASKEFAKALDKCKFSNLKKTVYSNYSAKPYSKTGSNIKQNLIKQITNPVLFHSSIEKAYLDGARVFIEIGPGKTLSSLASQVLLGKDFQTYSINPKNDVDSHYQLESFLTQLRVLGMNISSDPHYTPIKAKEKGDGKADYQIPSLLFVMDDTYQRGMDAMNVIDPLTPVYDETTSVSKPSITEKTNETPDIQDYQPEINKTSSPEVISASPALRKETAAEVEPKAPEPSYNEGDVVMAKNDPIVHTTMRYAYEMQSLNGDIFKQFISSQELQIDKFKDIAQSPNIPAGENLDGLLHFMELFQSNSIKAYETYFAEQGKMLNGADSNTANYESTAYSPQASENLIQTELDTPEVQLEPVHSEEVTPVILEQPVEEASPELDMTGIVLDSGSEIKPNLDVFFVGTTKEIIQKRITEVISDRTGYPEEMIDPDMDIESDLGIDSIRRVEIFSILNDEIAKGFTEEDVRVMATLHTIEEYAEFLENKINNEEEDPDAVYLTADNVTSFLENNDLSEENIAELRETAAQEVNAKKAGAPDKEDETEVQPSIADIKRYTVISKEIEIKTGEKPIVATEGLVLITWDDTGLSVELGKKLKKQGYEVAYIAFPWQNSHKSHTYKLEKISSADVEEVFNDLKSKSAPLTGFIHVGEALSVPKELDKIFDQNESESLKAVFLFAKYFKNNLVTPKDGKNFFMTIARMDGALGESSKWAGSTIQGGLFGMVKSLDKEWKSIYCKAIDISSDCDKETGADLSLEELLDSEKEYIEVARTAKGGRFINALSERTKDEPAKQRPDKNDVFLVTGGGRGVTAKCIMEFAKTYNSKFIILGRSSINNDLSWTDGEKDPDKLKPLLFNHLKEAGQVVKPAKVTEMINEILYQYEILDTLKAIDETGGSAMYISCDIKNQKAVNKAVSSGTKKMGNITGIIHGAGTIADKNMEHKTEQDLKKVYDTKVLGLEHCFRAVNPEEIKYIVTFSTTAAYYGNEGQVDYSISNEILNKFAFDFKKLYPKSFSLAINWGAWEGGMISEAIKIFLKAKGIPTIPYDIGSKMFTEQFGYSFASNECQLYISGTDSYITHELDAKQLSTTLKI